MNENHDFLKLCFGDALHVSIFENDDSEVSLTGIWE